MGVACPGPEFSKVGSYGVELALASTTCVRCNLILREVVKGFSKTDKRLEAGRDGEKIIMCTNLALNTEVPYAESTCHPKVIPKYTMAKRVFWRFAAA